MRRWPPPSEDHLTAGNRSREAFNFGLHKDDMP